MNTVLIFSAIVLYIIQSTSMKLLRADSLPEKLLVNGVFTTIAGAGMLIAGFVVPKLRIVSGTTLLFGIIFGISFALTILFYNIAISSGPLSYTAFYFSASMLIPTAAGILFFKEPLRFVLVGATILFLAAFYLLNVPAKTKDSDSSSKISPTYSSASTVKGTNISGGNKQNSKKKWLIFCGLTFLFNGLLAVLQKSHQTVMEGVESGGLMLVGFLTASVCYYIGYLIIRKKTFSAGILIQKNVLPVFLLAIGSLGGNLIATYLVNAVPGSYLFPLIQGSIIIGVTIVSILFFHERLSKQGKLGILLGVCAIVLINL